jgi:iron complex transport system ATP-binding protein
MILEVNNVSVKYDGREILRDITFSVAAGEIIVLIGANGAGKTTMLKAINGGVAIASGEIMIDGKSLSGMRRREIAKKVSVVAQENETKFPVSVEEFILAGRFAHASAFGWETKEDEVAAKQAMESCGLLDLRMRSMNELSGGERQRVVLARALAAGSELLMLDEPTANLDLSHQVMMFRLIREKCETRGLGSLVITHDLNLAAAFADKLVLIGGGKIIASGSPNEVLSAENLKNVYGIDVLIDENPSNGKIRVTTVYN